MVSARHAVKLPVHGTPNAALTKVPQDGPPTSPPSREPVTRSGGNQFVRHAACLSRGSLAVYLLPRSVGGMGSISTRLRVARHRKRLLTARGSGDHETGEELT